MSFIVFNWLLSNHIKLCFLRRGQQIGIGWSPSDVGRCVLHKRDYTFRYSSHTSSGMENGDIYDPFTTISFMLSSFHSLLYGIMFVLSRIGFVYFGILYLNMTYLLVIICINMILSLFSLESQYRMVPKTEKSRVE